MLLLTSWAGLDTNEVAAALDIPVGTVRSRLHRVRKWLRAIGSEDTIAGVTMTDAITWSVVDELGAKPAR